jgi:hypothetical protein
MFDLDRARPEDMAQLYVFAGGDSSLWYPEDLRALFRHQLELPLTSLGFGTGGPLDESRCKQEGGRKLADLLHSGDCSLDTLKWIKDYGKHQLRQDRPDLPKEVTLMLYYLAILAARVTCQERISSLSDMALRTGIEWALSQEWIDPLTKAVLSRGVATLI